jgi:CheY-like chemotaxis protein
MVDHGYSGEEPLKGWRILVVDDEEDVRTFLLTVFADAGAEICEAENGEEAIRMAQSLAPDLITLDLSMPGHDGAAAFAELRKTPGLEELPVCIVTGHPEMRALIYGRPPPEGFLTKPIAPEKLVATVRRILALKARKLAHTH